MATSAQSQENSARIIEKLAKLLVEFLGENKWYVETEALSILLEKPSRSLIVAAEAGQAMNLLDQWGKHLAKSRSGLVRDATAEQEKRGISRPILTKDMATRFIIECHAPNF
jgi:hypothetical protein